MRRILALVWLASLFLSGLADPAGTNASAWVDDGPLCLQSCRDSLWRVPFGDVATDIPPEDRSCTSQLALQSTFLCLRLYCLPEARDAAYGEFRETCLGQANNVTIPPLDIVDGYTREQIGEMERIRLSDTFEPEDKVDGLLIPTSELFTAWYTTLDAYKYVKYYHYNYGLAMVYFWAVVVAFGTGYRLLNAIIFNLSPKLQYTRRTGPFGSIAVWLQRKIILPATFGHRCARNIWWCTIPPRVQTLTLVVFAAINIIFSIHGYRLTAVNLYFPTISQQTLRYVSDRTGIISFANFPVIWLFGMRNNVAMWLTGWDFGAYNNFHRWVARIATVQAVVHSVGYTLLILPNDSWSDFFYWWTRWFWCAGVLATVFMCLLLACSVFWLRRQKYELFLVLHICMSAIILGTMLGHVSIFSGRYDALVWIPLSIWVLDRVVRLARVLAFKPKSWSALASLAYNGSSNMIRLQVPAEEKVYKARPGTFYYLSVLDVARSWESHPFTVATVCKGSASISGAEQMPLLETEAVDGQGIDETEGKTLSDPALMTFLIRPYDSFTKRLQELAVAKSQGPSAVRVVVDGPYGHTLALERFSHALFIVGGSGIVLPLSYLEHLVNQSPNEVAISIHWAVREPAFARDVLVNDMAEALDNEQVSAHIYGPFRGHDVLRDMPSSVEEHFGRPDIHGIIASKMAGQGIERLAVVVCGPAGMADDARRAVVNAVEYAPFGIEYFEEHFTW